MRPAERALIRSALPNFVNFMRFLHPGQACAAKFASSTAELGWDGSLMHCKRLGQVVPSLPLIAAKTCGFPRPPSLGYGPICLPSLPIDLLARLQFGRRNAHKRQRVGGVNMP